MEDFIGMNETKYGDLIAKIKKKRNWIIALTIVAVLLILLFGFPMHIEVLGVAIVSYEGLPTAVTVLLILLCCAVEIVAYAAVSLPLYTSMDQECDPEKHFILNMHLNKPKYLDSIYSTDYLYLGAYEESKKYAQIMIQKPNVHMVLVGLFNYARCEFFLGNYDSFRQTATQYEGVLSGSEKLKPKTKVVYEKMHKVLDLMSAIAGEDREKIKELKESVAPWNNSKATEGFLHYLRGLSAYKLDEREEAVYRFKTVEENCSKTVFARLSKHYLSLLAG